MEERSRCIITGTNASKLPLTFSENTDTFRKIMTQLRNAIGTVFLAGVDEFYTDCSYGFSLWGAETVLSLMKDNDIRLYVVYPYENQPADYAENWRDRFYKIHELCSDVIPMFLEYDELEDTRTFSKESPEALIKKAADFMLDDCGRLIFVGDPTGDYIYEQAVKRNYDIITLASQGGSPAADEGVWGGAPL